MALSRSARIVPHCFLFFVLIVLAGFSVLALKAGSESEQIAETNVVCKVLDNYVDDKRIKIHVACGGTVTDISTASLVIEVLQKNVNSIMCKKLYANRSLEDCTVRE